MIIILESQKDTYVTNIKTLNNNSSNSNVGKAATIDLFKLFNENKNAYSWAIFEFNSLIANGQLLKLIDTASNEKTFEFNLEGAANPNNVEIVGSDGSNEATLISNAVNALDDLLIEAYKTIDNKLILKQKNPGESGDTIIGLPNGMVHVGNSTKENFSRIDYSFGLIKFDLKSFKDKWITLDNNNELKASFSNLKAEVVLKDITTGIAKPKNYNLEIYKIKKDFLEGIGKDTIYFSDKGIANFVNINDNETWEVSEIVSNSDAESISSNVFNVVDGNENVSFDISEYVKSELKKANIDDKGFLIKFTDSYLYDSKSYFAKRLGSRHLINKKLIPELRIRVDDSSYHIPVNSFNKQRFLNNNEVFYLFNRANGNFLDLTLPNVNATLNFKINSKDNSVELGTVLASQEDVTNFKGEALPGIKKATININRFNENVLSLIKSGKLEANYVWYWSWQDGDNILTRNIIEKRVDFLVSETQNSFDFENLISTIKIDENFISGDDSVSSMKVYFTDTKKEYDAVKVPFQLPSENLGEVYYSVVDKNTDKVLIDFDTSFDSTKMFFDGEKYVFDFYSPSKYKNFIINFKFMYKDTITNTEKFIYNDKYSVRIK